MAVPFNRVTPAPPGGQKQQQQTRQRRRRQQRHEHDSDDDSDAEANVCVRAAPRLSETVRFHSRAFHILVDFVFAFCTRVQQSV